MTVALPLIKYASAVTTPGAQYRRRWKTRSGPPAWKVWKFSPDAGTVSGVVVNTASGMVIHGQRAVDGTLARLMNAYWVLNPE